MLRILCENVVPEMSQNSYYTNTPRGFHVETTWKRPFPRRFNVESTWCVCRIKIHVFDEISSINCLKQLSSNQKYLILQNHFQLNNSYALPKAIPHECQRSLKFEYLDSSFVYSMSDGAVHCIDCGMFLSARKQRSFGSFAKKG